MVPLLEDIAVLWSAYFYVFSLVQDSSRYSLLKMSPQGGRASVTVITINRKYKPR